jgi:hypothetical protein
LFPSSVREDARFVTLFTTYLDASRDEGDSNAYVLAGYISDSERWQVFDAEWQGILKNYEVSGPFHMTDFESRHGVFEGWERDDPRRVPLLTDLIAVTERHTVGSVGFGVSQSMYNALVPPDVNEYMGGSPYSLVFVNFVLNVEALMNRAATFAAGVPDDWQMIYVIARGDPGSGAVLNLWMDKTSAGVRMDTRTVGVFPARDNNYPSLQAADILAFEGRKQTGLQLGQHERPERQSFAVLDKARRPHRWRFIQHEHHLKAHVGSIQRAMRGETLEL